MPDEDPPRKFYDLKPREFERVNVPPAPASEAAKPVVPSATPMPDPARKIDVRELAQQATLPGPVLAPGSRPAGENEVHAMLRLNLAVENAAGLNALAPKPPKKSRRRRDYWLVMILFNGGFGALASHAYASGNAILFVYCLAGIGAFSAGVTWVMWFIMEDY